MKWSELADQPCSVSRTVAIIGDRWTLLLLRDCFNGSKRFEEFQGSLGISRTIVKDRLVLLVKEGVLAKVPYGPKKSRHEYRLTKKGLGLYPILMSIFRWGDEYYFQKMGPPLYFRHKNCGKEFHSELVCSECGEILDPRDVDVRSASYLKEM